MPRFTTDDGVELQYEVWGEGEPNVLHLPGWISTIESMRWAEPLTAAGVRVVAYELRGTGRSDRPPPTDDNYSVERLAADSIGLADSLAPAPLVAVGGFEAAHHAVRLAVARPAQVVGLVLAGPMLAPVAGRPMQMMWEGLIARGMSYALRSVADLAFSHLSEQDRAAFARSLEGHVDADVLLAIWRSIDVTDSRSLLSQIRCPTRVISSTDDIGIPLEWSERIAEQIPTGSLVKIEGPGTAASMAMTRSAELRAAIVELIQDL